MCRAFLFILAAGTGFGSGRSLAKEPASELKLEILDADGDLVRVFSSEGEGETGVVPEDAGMREWRLERVGTAKLPKTAGMHRFIWDLRHAGAWSEEARRSGRGGPLVAPGAYRARLTFGDWTRTASFAARLDPRVANLVGEADVAAQVELSLKARDALSSARLAAFRLKQALEGASAADEVRLDAVKKAFLTEPVRYSRPMLVDQIEYLYENLDSADQKPGRDAYRRYDELKAALAAQVAELNRILGTDED